MENSKAFVQAFVKKPEVEVKKEAFVKLNEAGGYLSDKINDEQNKDEVSPESYLKASVFLGSELAAEIGADISFTELMKIAREKGLKVGFYGAGVAWTGDQWSGREVADNPNWKPSSLLSLSSDMSQESLSKEKVEESKKVSALDFLASAGMDICITLDPARAEGLVSSLRADQIAKKVIYSELEEKSLKITEIDWSNSGIKEFQILLAAFEAIAVDLAAAGEMSDDFDAMAFLQNMASQSEIGEKSVRDKIPQEKIFRSGYEAAMYLSFFKKLNMDLFMGGVPANQVELATPFKLTRENPILKHINEAGMSLVDNLAYSLRTVAPDRLPGVQKHLLTRIQEMARGKRFSDLELADDLWKTTSKIARELMGGSRIVILADTSGSVVTSDKQFAGDDLRAMFGDKAIMVETHDWKPLPRRSDEGFAKTAEEERFRFERDYSKAQHGELKRAGVLPRLRQIVDEIKAGTFNRAKNQSERYVVVEPDATVYKQKKGTEVRLNKLSQ